MKQNFPSSSRRNKFELWVEILDLCSDNNIHLSKIMRELRLRTGKCKEYLTFLIQKDLLNISKDESDGSIRYLTTVKGKKAVKQFLQLFSKFFA